jgi:hypothetical protein
MRTATPLVSLSRPYSCSPESCPTGDYLSANANVILDFVMRSGKRRKRVLQLHSFAKRRRT